MYCLTEAHSSGARSGLYSLLLKTGPVITVGMTGVTGRQTSGRSGRRGMSRPSLFYHSLSSAVEDSELKGNQEVTQSHSLIPRVKNGGPEGWSGWPKVVRSRTEWWLLPLGYPLFSSHRNVLLPHFPFMPFISAFPPTLVTLQSSLPCSNSHFFRLLPGSPLVCTEGSSIAEIVIAGNQELSQQLRATAGANTAQRVSGTRLGGVRRTSWMLQPDGDV